MDVMTKMNELFTQFAANKGIDATQRASQGFISNMAGYAALIRVQNNCIKQGERTITIDEMPELKNIFDEVYDFKQSAAQRFNHDSNKFCLESFALAVKLEKAYAVYIKNKTGLEKE